MTIGLQKSRLPTKRNWWAKYRPCRQRHIAKRKTTWRGHHQCCHKKQHVSGLQDKTESTKTAPGMFCIHLMKQEESFPKRKLHEDLFSEKMTLIGQTYYSITLLHYINIVSYYINTEKCVGETNMLYCHAKVTYFRVHALYYYSPLRQ